MRALPLLVLALVPGCVHPSPAADAEGGVPVVAVDAWRFVRGADGAWEPWLGPRHGCSDGFDLDAEARVVRVWGWNLSGPAPAAVLAYGTGMGSQRVHGFPERLPHSTVVGRGNGTMSLEVGAGGVLVDGAPLAEGASVERSVEESGTREAFIVSYLGRFAPPAGSHAEYGCD